MLKFTRLFAFLLFITVTIASAAQTSFLQGNLSGAVRNNYSGFVGMQFTVGSAAMNVTAIGRVFLTGNTQTHTIKLVNAQTGVDVPGATTSLTMTAGTPNSYQYSSLISPVQLPANTSYFLLSQEANGGDTWYDYTSVVSTSDGKVNAPAYLTNAGSYQTVPVAAGTSLSYVPVNFLYSLALTASPAVAFAQPTSLNAALSGTVIIAATVPTVTSVQFEINGSPIGGAISAPPYQVSLDTTRFPDGTYTLSVIATDSSGDPGQASSFVTFLNGNVRTGVPFVSAETLSGLRNNFSGFVGMQFTVGSQPLTINSLGRLAAPGNSGIHLVKLVDAASGLDVPGASVELNMAGTTAQQFKYQGLITPLVLPAYGSYYLMSAETQGGDQWYDYSPVANSSVATILGPVYLTGTGYTLVNARGSGYVPLSFLFASNPPAVTVTSPTPGAVSGTVNFNAQATAASSLAIVSLQLSIDGANFGAANTSGGATASISLPLATSTLTSGIHTLTATATDSAGQSATSAGVPIAVNAGSPLITAQSLQSPLRANFTGAVGMQIQVASVALVVTQLGRFCVAGNAQTHTVKLVQANGSDVAGGSVTVSMAGCTPGQYVYFPLAGTVTLAANTSYNLVTLETNGGDQWYDYGQVTASSAASVLAPVYAPSGGLYVLVAAQPGWSYGPVNLSYQSTAAPTVTVSAPASPVSGVITLTANATPGSGLTIVSVQFQQNGVNIGAPVTGAGPLYTTQFDTTTLQNSTYSITAIAKDSAGNSTTSLPIAITTSNASASNGGSPFVVQQTAGVLRNNFSGLVGMQFQVGATPLAINQLGRLCVAGNSGTHLLKLVSGAGVDVPGGSASVLMSGCSAGSFRYAVLSSPITLTAASTYYLVGQEVSGGDQWYDYEPVVTATVAVVNGPAYSTGNGVYTVLNPSPGSYSYGPYNFLYSAAAVAPPVITLTAPAANAVLSGTATLSAIATASSGLNMASVQFQFSGVNVGPLVTGLGPTFSLALDTRPLLNGGYQLTAIATDSGGNETFSSAINISVSNNITPPTASVMAPKAATTETGLITVSATAAPASGTTLASLQLKVDGRNFGALCATATCSASLDTTLLPNGTHVLTAVATDADEGSATSAPISITASNTVTGIGLLNGFVPGLARTYAGWIGMHFTTGCNPISVSALGRIYVPGNNQTHQLKLVLAGTGVDVPGGAATLSFTGAISNQIVYANLAAPITLQASTEYYLVSNETSGGDQFYDFEPILPVGAVTVNGPAYQQSGSWITPQNPNYIYVPVDLKFSVPGVTFPAAVTPVNSTVTGTPYTAITPASYNHTLVYGQSLAVGFTGSPQLTTTQPYSNVMLTRGNAALAPLIEGLGYGANVSANTETIDSALGNTITRLSTSSTFTDVVTNAGLGGASYAQLAKGTTPYATAIAQLTAANSLALAAAKTYKVSGIALMHGETDQAQAASPATYESYLVQWQSDFQTDAKAISKQTDPVPFFIDQTNSWTSTFENLSTPTVALGQVAAATDHPTTIFLVGPKYQYHYNDGLHMDDFGYRKQGEQFGKVMKQVLLGGTAWKSLSPSSVTRSGSIITAKFNVPVQPLQFDTSTVLPKVGMGFEYTDGTGCSPFVVSAQITAGDTVTIKLSATPTGASGHLRYAYTGIAGAPSGRDSPGAARGNLKDSDTTSSAYGNDLANWAVSFDVIVP